MLFSITQNGELTLRKFGDSKLLITIELAFYLFGGPLGDLYFIGTLSQTLSLRAAFRPFRICCRKYPDPAGRLTTTFSPAGEILFHP